MVAFHEGLGSDTSSSSLSSEYSTFHFLLPPFLVVWAFHLGLTDERDSVKDYFQVVYFFVYLVFYHLFWFQTTLPSINTLSTLCHSYFFGHSYVGLLQDWVLTQWDDDDSSDSSTTFHSLPLVFLGTATSEDDLSFSDFFSEEYSLEDYFLDSYLIDDFFSDSDSCLGSDFQMDSDFWIDSDLWIDSDCLIDSDLWDSDLWDSDLWDSDF